MLAHAISSNIPIAPVRRTHIGEFEKRFIYIFSYLTASSGVEQNDRWPVIIPNPPFNARYYGTSHMCLESFLLAFRNIFPGCDTGWLSLSSSTP